MVVRSEYSKSRIEKAAIEFHKKAPLIHADRLDFSKSVYTGSKENIDVECPVHGVFPITPASILLGYGCKKCGSKRAGW